MRNERFDLNSDYNNSNYTFTAPVTGKYQANVVIRFSYLSQGAAYYYVELNTSNDNYYNIFDPDFGQDTTFWTVTFSSLITELANSNVCLMFSMDGSLEIIFFSLAV